MSKRNVFDMKRLYLSVDNPLLFWLLNLIFTSAFSSILSSANVISLALL